MGFLAPWYLLLAGAVLVPILIHLLRRRIGVQVEFPAARYLARAEREHSRTLRMRNLLLMLLRVLAIVLLAIAASRPMAHGTGAGHAPTALAIVLDNSMSTSVIEGGTPLVEQFKRAARDAIATATPEDRLWLATVDGPLRGGTPATIREEVERVRPYAGAGRMHDAMVRAVAAVEASGMEARQVAVLTDGQRTTWSEPSHLRTDVPVLIWSPRTPPPMNRAVMSAEARPIRWTPRGAVAARILSADSTTYRMTIGGRTLARGTVGPGEEAIVHAAPPERGWTAGTVEIEPDELAADNVRHFALWIGAAPSVHVAASAGPFVRNAIDVLRSSQRVAARAGILIASSDEVATLPALLLPPTDAVRLGAANRALERLGVAWRFGPLMREVFTVHGAGMDGVSVSWRYQLVSRGVSDAETLVVAGREPWIVSGTKYVVVGSPLVPEATSLPVSAAFLPWLGDVIASRLHADPGAVRSATPGERVTRPSGVDALERAVGGRIPLTGNSFEVPAAAGTYFYIQGTRRVGALVVNPELAESQLARWSPSELRQRIVTAGAYSARDLGEWVRMVFTGAARRSLVVPLLFAALLVLSAEAVVTATGGRGEQ